ncbi:MAG TPA: hypothetical protein VNT27_15805, partial [Propionibacteriaceae bacterium]|nr:hypothetical protein [Propionibacteriaceae bacterium]
MQRQKPVGGFYDAASDVFVVEQVGAVQRKVEPSWPRHPVEVEAGEVEHVGGVDRRCAQRLEVGL